MATCKPFATLLHEREDPIGSGSGWTTDDLTMQTGEKLETRARFTVISLPGYVDCTARLHQQLSDDGGASYRDYALAKFAEAGFGKYYPGFFQTNVEATYLLRAWLEYAGNDHYTTPFTVRVNAWRISRVMWSAYRDRGGPREYWTGTGWDPRLEQARKWGTKETAQSDLLAAGEGGSVARVDFLARGPVRP